MNYLPNRIPDFTEPLDISSNVSDLIVRLDWIILIAILICILLILVIVYIRKLIIQQKELDSRNKGLFDDLENHFKQTKFEKLKNVSRVAMELYPQHAEPYWYQAVANYHLGDMDEAKKHFENSLWLNPGLENITLPYLGRIEKIEMDNKDDNDEIN